MFDLRFASRWRLASALLLVSLLILMLLPEPSDWPNLSEYTFENSDKLVHFIVFTALAIWFAGLYRRALYWRIAGGLVLYGLLIEVLQSATNFRSGEVLDLFADIAGIAVGIIVANLGFAGWSKRVESKWFCRDE